MGGVLDLETARVIRTSVIAGAANNILAEPAAGHELVRRGIVYAPDFVSNAGGAIHLVGREVLGWTADEVSTHVENIGGTLMRIFADARTRGVSPDRAARDMAASRLSLSPAG
jgi:leucine dehydrogenase